MGLADKDKRKRKRSDSDVCQKPQHPQKNPNMKNHPLPSNDPLSTTAIPPPPKKKLNTLSQMKGDTKPTGTSYLK